MEVFIIGSWALNYEATLKGFDAELVKPLNIEQREKLTSMWDRATFKLEITSTTITQHDHPDVYDIVFLRSDCVDIEIFNSTSEKKLHLRRHSDQLYSTHESCEEVDFVKPKWIYTRVDA